MSEPTPRRLPQVFDANDPRLRPDGPAGASADTPPSDDTPAARAPVAVSGGIRMPTTADLHNGMRWGMILVSSAVSLFVMSLALRFWSFVWDLFLRRDWIGWVAVVLAGLLIVSLTMLLAREVLGFLRLAKLQQLRRQAERVLADSKDLPSDNSVLRTNDLALRTNDLVLRIRALYAVRPELAWARSRLAGHDTTIMSAVERLALCDRELLAAIDDQAKVAIAQSARRVSVVTAITPFAVFDMAFVLYENLRMLRRIATAYGGRPGLAGLIQLAGRVIGHVVATGGLALTDDLFGQFIGQGLAKRLSARAGQGMFNGGLTARLGVAAIDMCRPLPFIEARRPRFRDLALEAARGLTIAKKDEAATD